MNEVMSVLIECFEYLDENKGNGLKFICQMVNFNIESEMV